MLISQCTVEVKKKALTLKIYTSNIIKITSVQPLSDELQEEMFAVM